MSGKLGLAIKVTDAYKGPWWASVVASEIAIIRGVSKYEYLIQYKEFEETLWIPKDVAVFSDADVPSWSLYERPYECYAAVVEYEKTRVIKDFVSDRRIY